MTNPIHFLYHDFLGLKIVNHILKLMNVAWIQSFPFQIIETVKIDYAFKYNDLSTTLMVLTVMTMSVDVTRMDPAHSQHLTAPATVIQGAIL